MSEFHTKHNPELGEVTLYGFIDTLTRKIFGEYKDGRDRLKKMQMMQCEWIRLTLELMRRSGGYCSGILYWMYNDCWPAANGWSLVDYYAYPKPAYYAFKRGAKPLVSSIEKVDGEYRVFISNDGEEAKEGRGRVYVYDFQNDKNIKERHFTFKIADGAVLCAESFTANEFDEYLSPNCIILCDIESGALSDRSYIIQNRYSDLELKYGEVRIIGEDDEFITVTSDNFNPIALIDLPMLLEENAFPIKRGEVKKIRKLSKL
jgi:beta-mannosidase